MKYAVLYERDESGTIGAHVPDLPGCAVVASTIEEARGLIKAAIEMHLEGMREDGTPIPAPTTHAEYVDAA